MHPLTLLVPNLALQYALLWTNLKVGKLELSLLHLATVISTVYMRLFLVERDEARRARQMGARTWPILRTGWPLNLDLLVRQARALFHEVALKTTVDAAPDGALTFDRRFLGISDVVTQDERVIQHILSDDFANWKSSAKDTFHAWLGEDGLFFSEPNGKNDWHAERKAVRPYFTPAVMRDLEPLRAHTDRFCDILGGGSEGAGAVDVAEASICYVTDTACEFTFGRGIGAQSAEEDKAAVGKRIAAAFGEAVHACFLQSVWLGLTPLITQGKNLLTEPLELINRVTKQEMDRIMDEHRAGRNLDLACHRYLEESGFDVIKCRNSGIANVMTIRDGNSPLVTACLYELARHPDIQKEAREEVLRLGGEKVNYDQLKSMRFLRAVIDEALRLYPSAPVNARDCLEDNSCVASDGHRYCFAAGTEVTINVYALQRRKDLWGNDADKFRPSRWSEEGIPAHNAFMPFGLTPRNCMGRDYVYTQLLLVLATVLRRFRSIEVVPQPDSSPAPISGFMLYWVDGPFLRFVE